MKPINLENVKVTNDNQRLFDVAARTGDTMVLDQTDAIDYALFADAFESCGSGSSAQVGICQQRVRTADQRQKPSSGKDVGQKLKLQPEAKQKAILKRAERFMKDAKDLVK